METSNPCYLCQHLLSLITSMVSPLHQHPPSAPSPHACPASPPPSSFRLHPRTGRPAPWGLARHFSRPGPLPLPASANRPRRPQAAPVGAILVEGSFGFRIGFSAAESTGRRPPALLRAQRNAVEVGKKKPKKPKQKTHHNPPLKIRRSGLKPAAAPARGGPAWSGPDSAAAAGRLCGHGGR